VYLDTNHNVGYLKDQLIVSFLQDNYLLVHLEKDNEKMDIKSINISFVHIRQ
jgi:hypothetical protein